MNSKKFNRYVARILKGMSAEEMAIADKFEDAVDRVIGTVYPRDEPEYSIDVESGQIVLGLIPEEDIPVEKRQTNKLVSLLGRQGYNHLDTDFGKDVILTFAPIGGVASKIAKEPVDLEQMQSRDMGEWIVQAFEMYNDLLDHMAKVNIRDEDIAKEWKKVDKAFDAIIKVVNKKKYLAKSQTAKKQMRLIPGSGYTKDDGVNFVRTGPEGKVIKEILEEVKPPIKGANLKVLFEDNTKGFVKSVLIEDI